MSIAVESMRTAWLVAPGRFEVGETELPSPAPGEVRVRLEGCGVCASNLEVFEGRPWFEYPRAPGSPGHEGWGRIDQLGSGVQRLRVGDRVALLSNRAYAEYAVAAADQVVPLPAALDGAPFPGEPLGCAVNVLRRSRVEPGETVAVVGAGFLGTLFCRLAARAGAHVIALGRRAAALEVARRFGAAETVALDDDAAVVDAVSGLTGGRLCDRVIEATGQQRPLKLAAELTRERGTMVIAGYHQDGLREVDMQLWNWRGLDVVNAHERDPAVYVEGIREAARLSADGELDATPLYTHRFPLDRLGDAFRATRERPDGFMKALVMV